jgi:hypothetical protein
MAVENQFFTWIDFVSSFGREMRTAEDILSTWCRGVSRTIACAAESLERLAEFLRSHYPYSIEYPPTAVRMLADVGLHAHESKRRHANGRFHWALDHTCVFSSTRRCDSRHPQRPSQQVYSPADPVKES